MGMALLAIGVLGLVRPTRESVVASAEAPATTISRIEPAVPTEPSTTTTHDKPAGPPEPTTVPPARPSCGPVGAPDLDDDGCGDQLDIEGTIVRVGDLRFQVGRPDDVVTLGDWDCDGVVTPALLRPSTGEVFVFSEWTESQLSVRPIERVPLARTIHPDEDGIGCHQLVVEDADGRRTTIDAR